jgi:hypothetical protein
MTLSMSEIVASMSLGAQREWPQRSGLTNRPSHECAPLNDTPESEWGREYSNGPPHPHA